MASAQQGYRRRRPAEGFVALLTGFLITVILLAGAALLFGRDLFPSDEETDTEDTTTSSAVAADQPGAQAALDEFAAALAGGDLSALSFARSVTGPEANGQFSSLTRGLAPFTLSAEVGTASLGPDRSTATAPIDLTWAFPGEMSWTTSSQVSLDLVDDTWRVRWSASVLEPSLSINDELLRRRLEPGRAQILGRNGVVLVDQIDVVDVGIQPSRVQDLPSLVAQLEALVGIDPAELTARVEAASPDAFVEVVTLPRAEYDLVRDEIFPLPGTVFRESTRPSTIDPSFARALLGRSGEVTAEVIEEFPGLFEPGDFVGISGLQSTYNGVLAGSPGMQVLVIRGPPDPSSTTTGTGLTTTSSVIEVGEPIVLYEVPATSGQAVETTIDPRVQQAAELALERTELPSALVAIEVSTGDVVAVANGPRGATVNFAMTGRYPPGSIFKIVSGYALLRDRIDANDRVECPQTITVNGRSFGNAEDEVLGNVSFRDAFAHSCNTAFVFATDGFGFEVLNRTALEFGLGLDYDLGDDAFSGSVPVAEDEVDLAAAAFGQGRILFSPLSAAVMAATAADGTYRSPRLVLSPAPPTPQEIVRLDRRAADDLQELMRAVVTEGTGRAVASVIGAPVSGKTGTAEFGNQVPPQSHAWFVGYQGDLAFAVFVEAGEFGGSTAAPIARDFLNSLAG